MEPTIFKPRLKFKPPLKFFKFGHRPITLRGEGQIYERFPVQLCNLVAPVDFNLSTSVKKANFTEKKIKTFLNTSLNISLIKAVMIENIFESA